MRLYGGGSGVAAAPWTQHAGGTSATRRWWGPTPTIAGHFLENIESFWGCSILLEFKVL